MHWLFALISLSFAAFSHASCVAPVAVAGDTKLHDPTMCKDNAGIYFLFSTAVGIETRISVDRQNWTLVGKVWPDGAPWTDQYTGTSNGNLWAPDCTYVDGQFILYYSASTIGSQNSAIFLAKSSTGLPGNWTHEGMVISTSGANNYNAIDPNLLIDGDRWLLSFGSFWSGIKSMNLDTTGLPSDTSLSPLAQRTVNNGALEASNVFKYNGFYYLFTSWDNCCLNVSSTYNIRVGRSDSPTGGFVDKYGVSLLDGGGTLVLASHDDVIGTGGQDLMIDDDGPILIYHYYTPSGNFLGINKLDFSSGWPVVV